MTFPKLAPLLKERKPGTECTKCGRELTKNEIEGEKMVLCPFCNFFIGKGSHNFHELKDEQSERRFKKKMEKKEAVNKKVAKEKSEKVKKEKLEKNPKFGKEIETKVISLAKQGKSFSEISNALGGHPAVPKIKRILSAANVEVKKKKEVVNKKVKKEEKEEKLEKEDVN